MKMPTHYKIPRSKAEAKKRGALYYVNGKTCSKGHTSSRYVNSGKCVACTKANKEKHKFPAGFKHGKAQNIRTRIEAITEKSDFEESWD